MGMSWHRMGLSTFYFSGSTVKLILVVFLIGRKRVAYRSVHLYLNGIPMNIRSWR